VPRGGGGPRQPAQLPGGVCGRIARKPNAWLACQTRASVNPAAWRRLATGPGRQAPWCRRGEAGGTGSHRGGHALVEKRVTIRDGVARAQPDDRPAFGLHQRERVDRGRPDPAPRRSSRATTSRRSVRSTVIVRVVSAATASSSRPHCCSRVLSATRNGLSSRVSMARADSGVCIQPSVAGIAPSLAMPTPAR
jgi:hypothetical protein